MIIPENCHEVFVPVSAGIIVSLLNRFILNNPNFAMCSATSCNQTAEETEVEGEMDREKSGSSGSLSSTLEVPHANHASHVYTH